MKSQSGPGNIPLWLMALARVSLGCFAMLHMPSLLLPWHLRTIIKHLEAVEKGTLRRLTIAAPPRHGKSLITSVFFVSWFLSIRPELEVMILCYGEELAQQFGAKVRDILASPLNRQIFSDCQLSETSSAAHRFRTTKGGGLLAVGLGGPITGMGADLIVVDDSLKDPNDAKSETVRKALHAFFAEVVYARQSPTGRIVVVGARSHRLDLIGWLHLYHSEDGWVKLSFPAIATKDEKHRKAGEPLWPGPWPLESLERTWAMMGAAFYGFYLQDPRDSEFSIFKREWFQYVEQVGLGGRIAVSCDFAFKTEARHDYSAILTVVEANGYWVIVDALRGKWTFPELKTIVRDHALRWHAHIILVEEAGPGGPLVDDLRSLRLPLLPVRPRGDKEARAHAATSMIQTGLIRLLRSGRGMDVFLEEVCGFRNGADHDDFVDALSQLATYLRDNPGPRFSDVLMAVLGPPSWEEESPYIKANMVELPPGWTPPRGPRRF